MMANICDVTACEGRTK